MSGAENSENSRAARLAGALRENLRKRKAQARSRRQAGPAAPRDAEQGGGPAEDETRRTSRATDGD